MKEYKKEFNKNSAGHWKFQDEELEQDYIKFVKSVEKQDKKLMKERKIWDRETKHLTIMKELEEIELLNHENDWGFMYM